MELSEVIKNLLSLYRENRLAHAYLLETNNVQKCYDEIKELIKMISCKKEYSPNCLKCNICNLITINNLPSLITIGPDGKNIKKEAIEQLKEKFSCMPVYTDKNIYVIKYPEKMNDTSFNKMLKFLEEPENDIIGFFITENKDDVASTIVSRCEVIKVKYNDINIYDELGLNEEQYAKLTDLATKYISEIEIGSKSGLWYNNTVLLKELSDRVDVTNLLKVLLSIYQNDLNSNISKVKIIVKYLNQLNYNVNLSLLLDSFVIEMRQTYEN